MDIGTEYKKYTLDNRLVIVLKKLPSQRVTARLRVSSGTASENENELGLSHYLEHNIYNGGSNKYDSHTNKEVHRSLPYSNAFTNLAETTMIGSMLPSDLPLYLDLISGSFFNPLIDAEILEEERQRVLREIAEHKGKPSYNDSREYMSAFYKLPCYTKEIFGDEGIISNVTREQLLDFHRRRYSTNLMDLIITGDVDESTLQLAKKYFKDIQSLNLETFHFHGLSTLEGKIIMNRKADDLLIKSNPEQSNAGLTIKIIADSEKSRDYYSLVILTHILGSGQNSRLFKRISEKEGLAYSIWGRYFGRINYGEIEIEGEVHAPRIEQAIDNIFEELLLLEENFVDDKELNIAKNNLLYSILAASETVYAHHSNDSIDLIRRELDTGVSLDTDLIKFSQITAKDILETARKYLPKSRQDDKYAILVRNPLL